MLDFDTCNAARLNRDPACDGRFFTAVRTTRFCCRPVFRLQVARPVRIQRARRLLAEGGLPMTEAAFRSGFGSVRRFNAAFAEHYGRPPSSLNAARP